MDKMRVLVVSILVLGWIGLATSQPQGGSKLQRRKLQDDENENDGPSGFFAAIWAVLTGAETSWKEGDDHDINDLGAVVLEMTIDGEF